MALYRSIYYLPSLLGGSVAVAVLWRQLFASNGVIPEIAGFFGITMGGGGLLIRATRSTR